ncbi:ATP-binding protein [Nocardia coubleae]|uniref:Sensor histidine kinase n=1 Tax=Nocardia coubleae TaxID=356147 RepID=A0A846W1E8_9NOCA|nr:ATP-binding protein [Nocardia coubleae]NKX86979.1 sensor histidine kinase [Nocardia coubleae]
MTRPVLEARRRDTVHHGDLEVDLDSLTPASTRVMVREFLAPLPETSAADTIQVFDELASNARRHGLPPRRARLSLDHVRDRVRIEVDDTGPGEPHPRAPDHTGGLGLLLVGNLADTWSCSRYDGHKTIQAELTFAHDVRPAA